MMPQIIENIQLHEQFIVGLLHMDVEQLLLNDNNRYNYKDYFRMHAYTTLIENMTII